MKNKKGNTAVIAIIIVIVAITFAVIGYLFAKKSQAPAAQPVAMQSAAPTAPSAQTPEQNVPVQATMSTTQPVTQQPASVNKDANSKTFASSTNKVSFNYSSSDVVSENKNVITITGISGIAAANGTDDKATLVITIFNNPEGKALKDWFASNFNRAVDKDCFATDSNLNFGTYQSVLFSAPTLPQACDDAGYYAISQNNTMIAKFGLGQDPVADLDEIQSSFKFTN